MNNKRNKLKNWWVSEIAEAYCSTIVKFPGQPTRIIHCCSTRLIIRRRKTQNSVKCTLYLQILISIAFIIRLQQWYKAHMERTRLCKTTQPFCHEAPLCWVKDPYIQHMQPPLPPFASAIYESYHMLFATGARSVATPKLTQQCRTWFSDW